VKNYKIAKNLDNANLHEANEYKPYKRKPIKYEIRLRITLR